MAMQDNGFRVTFEVIEEVAAQTRGVAANIEQLLTDLDRYLARFAPEWEGGAAEAYQTQQQAWNDAGWDLNNVLKDVAQLLLDAHSSYTSTESELTSMWTD